MLSRTRKKLSCGCMFLGEEKGRAWCGTTNLLDLKVKGRKKQYGHILKERNKKWRKKKNLYQ